MGGENSPVRRASSVATSFGVHSKSLGSENQIFVALLVSQLIGHSLPFKILRLFLQNTAFDLYLNDFASDVNCNKAIAFEIVRQITPVNSRQITFD